MKLPEFPGKPGKLSGTTLGFLLLFLIGVLDYVMGIEVSFSVFYIFPIALITLAGDWKLGVISAFIGAATWFTVEILTGRTYSHQAIQYWNTFVRLAFFLLVVYAIRLGGLLERESSIARTDFVTNALNSRYFHEQLQIEIDRASRYEHPFTVMYLDIDDFKVVNDCFGHSMGDRVLHEIAEKLKRTLRKTDIIARAGGDEFIVLLPETTSDAAQSVVSKALEILSDRDVNLPVTFSAGVVTFLQAPQSVDAALNMADKVMYEVKSHGKNNVIFSVYQ